LQLIGEFGDGVWGQEQERAELGGMGLAFAFGDRIEVGGSAYLSTRTVRDSVGEPHHGRGTLGLRGKVRLADLIGDRVSIGIHIAYMPSSRVAESGRIPGRRVVQDERMNAWDFALPVEVYPLGAPLPDRRWSVYAGPRLVFQSFEDDLSQERTEGTLAAALVGSAGRWRRVALAGELNLARTPDMTFADMSFGGGWILLPMASLRVVIWIGD
jgi:hypothetical protein